MDKLSRLAGVLVCAAMVASAGCASNSGVSPVTGSSNQLQMQTVSHSGPGWINDHGVVYHVPHYMPTRSMAANRVHPDILLTYGGGPVLTNPKIYLIFWGYPAAGDPNKLKALLKHYAKAVGGSPLANVLTQYHGPSGNITNPNNQFGGFWIDNSAIPSHPTDSQVAAEAIAGVAHFGYDPNGSYVVATAHLHSSSGFGTQYCAYHSDTVQGNNVIAYTNLPYMPDAGQSCGANIITPPSDETGVDEGVTIVEGHEYAESITDPAPFSGWNSSQGEIGDLCAWTNILNDPFGTKSYSAQPEFSNATASCKHSYP